MMGSPCDEISGDCSCKRYVTGRYCNQCLVSSDSNVNTEMLLNKGFIPNCEETIMIELVNVQLKKKMKKANHKDI